MANENRERIRELTEQGMSVRDIAKLLDMSTQGVYWHLRKMDEERQEARGAA